MCNDFYDEIYTFECYISENEPTNILEFEPDDDWVKFIFREPEWWRYDKLIHGNSNNPDNDCFFRVSETKKWSINEIKKRRQLMKYGLKRIETSTGEVKTKNFKISDESGDALSVYYSEKILLSDQEAEQIKEDLDIYNKSDDILKLKPPFHRLIIEMDIVRRIGGYSREDIMNLSKKDMDIIYLLHRYGLTIPIREYIKNISPMKIKDENNINNIADRFNIEKHKLTELV